MITETVPALRPPPSETGCPLQGRTSTALRTKRNHATAPAPGPDPINLGQAVDQWRTSHADGTIDPALKAALDALGFIWNANDHDWQQFLDDLDAFKEAAGHTEIPVKYVTTENPPRPLGAQAHGYRQRAREGRLTPGQITDLTNRGFTWEPRQAQFQRAVHAIRRFTEEHGHTDIPQSHVTPPPEKLKLGVWISNRRVQYKNGTLRPEHAQALLELGVRLGPPHEQADGDATSTRTGP